MVVLTILLGRLRINYMYKETGLLKLVDINGQITYAIPNSLNDDMHTLVNNDEIEFENGVLSSIKDNEFIHYKGMTIGTGNRLAGVFDRESDEDFEKRIMEEMDYPEVPSTTDPLDDWLS